jgi:hypothetical protein
VKVLLTIVVFIALTLALAVVSLFTPKPQANDGFDEDV